MDKFEEQLFSVGIDEVDQEKYFKLIRGISQEYKPTLKEFIVNLASKGKRLKTIESYLNDLKEFIKYVDFKGKDINNLEYGDIERYKNYLLKHGLKAKSVNRHLTSINQFLKYTKSQVNFKKIKEQKQNFLNDVLSKEDIEKLLKSCGDNLRDKAIMLTLYKTGLRVSELLALTTKDINRNSIDVEGKGGKYRRIPIVKEVHDLWVEYLKVRIPTDSNILFTGTQGPLKRNSINKIISKYALKTRIKKEKAHPHSFRHAFCKALADSGMSLGAIADLAGHQTLETTRIYTMQTEKELRNAIDRI